MKLISSILNIFFLPGFLYSLILITSYYQLYVLVVIGVSALLNYIILKAIYFNKKETDTIIKKLYNNEKEFGTKEMNNVFWMTVYTAWVSPCTVWCNSFALKTKFLLVSSSITIAVYALSITVLHILVHSYGLIDEVNPPVSHCFNYTKLFNSSNYNLHFSGSLSFSTLNICEQNDECFPTIRICSDNENPTDYLDLVCFKIGYSLLLLSFCSSICLQILGSYSVMHKYFGFFSCPKMFYNFFQEVAENYESLNSKKQKELFDIVQARIGNKQESAKIKNKNIFFDFAKSSIGKSHENAKMLKQFVKNSRNKENHKVWNDLINTSHDIEDKIPKNGWSPMHEALKQNKYGLWCFFNILGGVAGALNGHSQSTIHILSGERDYDQKWLSSNAFVRWWIRKSRQKYGNHALHKAAELGDTVLVEIIIENGYDIGKRNWIRQTALHIAAEEGHFECVKYLIDKGADLEVKDMLGRTTLHSAAEGGNLESLKYLVDNGADLKAEDEYERTPLHAAVEGGHLECLKYLTDKGADLEAKDHAGRTPLHLSASVGWNLECVTLLIEQKAEVNASDRQNNTPLHILRKKYNLEQNSCLSIAEELIKAGADLTAVNNKGKTPMDNEHVQQLREEKPELFHKMK
jgi:ankyrin repeat protein